MKQISQGSKANSDSSLFKNLSIASVAIIGLLIAGGYHGSKKENQHTRSLSMGSLKNTQTDSRYEPELLTTDPIPVALAPEQPANQLANLDENRPKLEMDDFLDQLKSQDQYDLDINDVLQSLHDSHTDGDMRAVVNWVTGAQKSIHGIGYEIAEQYRQRSDYNDAYKWYEIALKKVPSPQTYYQLAAAEMLGQGTQVNYTKAKTHLYQSVKNNHPDAAHLLGINYLAGLDTESNTGFAYQWFQKSIAKGGNRGFAESGRMRELGLGVKQDTERAIEIYQLGAEQGDSYCAYRLTMLDGKKVAELNEPTDQAFVYETEFSHLLPEGFLF